MFRIYTFVLASLFLASLSSLSHSQTIGTAVKADRTVTGSRSGVLKKSSKVYANERIRANSTGLGHIEFNDGTKMVVGPGTRLTLDDAIYNPNGSSFKKFSLKTTAGALRFISGGSASSSYAIETPAGTLGIRGTAFDMQHLNGRTYLMLVSGEVEFCSRSGNCETIRRRCDYVVASNSGRVSDPVQPRNGVFEVRDMRRYFPLIHDQRPILPNFRLAVGSCDGGAAGDTGDGAGSDNGGFDGNDGGDGDTVGNPSGGNNTGGDITGGGNTGGDQTGGDPGRGGPTGGGDTAGTGGPTGDPNGDNGDGDGD